MRVQRKNSVKTGAASDGAFEEVRGEGSMAHSRERLTREVEQTVNKFLHDHGVTSPTAEAVKATAAPAALALPSSEDSYYWELGSHEIHGRVIHVQSGINLVAPMLACISLPEQSDSSRSPENSSGSTNQTATGSAAAPNQALLERAGFDNIAEVQRAVRKSEERVKAKSAA